MAYIAVNGCTFKLSSTDGQVSGSTSVDPTCLPSSDVFVSDKGVYFDKIKVLLSTLIITPTVTPTGTTGTGKLISDSIEINGTGSNILNASDKKAVLKGDKNTASFEFTFTTTSTPPEEVPLPYSVTVEVDDAGQTDVEAL